MKITVSDKMLIDDKDLAELQVFFENIGFKEFDPYEKLDIKSLQPKEPLLRYAVTLNDEGTYYTTMHTKTGATTITFESKHTEETYLCFTGQVVDVDHIFVAFFMAGIYAEHPEFQDTVIEQVIEFIDGPEEERLKDILKDLDDEETSV